METSKAQPKKPFRILSLDGGGAKGFYTLGVLREIEGMAQSKLCDLFELVYGTSTGAIIAGLIAIGLSIDEIQQLYKEHVPRIMQQKKSKQKSDALAALADEVFGHTMFTDAKTNIGIVSTRWIIERPMIFKNNREQAHGRAGTFVPGFGVPMSHAIQASCSAYPFFDTKTVVTSSGDQIELVDGGYCANNPTLYAIADATRAMKIPIENLRVISVGVGIYPEPKASLFNKMYWAKYLQSVQLLQKTLEINTQSMDQLRSTLYKHIPTVRISDTFEKPDMATDLFEHNLKKLNILQQRGSESFAQRETEIQQLILGEQHGN